MGDAEVEFNKMLSKIEDEILALKTAHQRPLGALNFFKKSESFGVTLTPSLGIYAAEIYIHVKIAEPATKPPIVQTGWDTPPHFYSVSFQNLVVSADYSEWTYELQFISSTVSSLMLNVSTLSSQPIESITWEYV